MAGRVQIVGGTISRVPPTIRRSSTIRNCVVCGDAVPNLTTASYGRCQTSWITREIVDDVVIDGVVYVRRRRIRIPVFQTGYVCGECSDAVALATYEKDGERRPRFEPRTPR